MLGSFDHLTRRLVVHKSPTKRSSDFVAHLEQLDQLYGPKPGPFTKPVVLVLDNGPIHTSKLSLAALASRAHWLTVEWLPKYAPELNDIEGVWRDLKAHHLAHQTFADADALNTAIHQAVDALNLERTPLPLVKLRNLCLNLVFIAFRRSEASTPLCPPDRNEIPGSATGTTRRKTPTVASATSSAVGCFGQVNPGSTMFGLRIIPSSATP